MRLTIRGRLIAVVCLSLIPIALLGYLFVAQSQKDIAFGSKEIEGARYYAALASRSHGADRGGNLADDGKFRAVRPPTIAEMDSVPLADSYAKLRAQASGRLFGETTAALLALLAKVGDASNLILDPDLDSYYVMDMLVTKLPAAFDASAALKQNLTTVAAAPSDDGRISLVAARGAFDALVAATQNSLASGIAGNPDGHVKLRSSGPTARFRRSRCDPFDCRERSRPRLRPGRHAKARSRQGGGGSSGIHRSADKLNAAVNAELSRLLQVRIDGFNRG